MAIVINDDGQRNARRALPLVGADIDMWLIDELHPSIMVMPMMEGWSGPLEPMGSSRTITSQITAVKTSTGLRTFRRCCAAGLITCPGLDREVIVPAERG
jgi:hypothetical protein